MSIVKFYRGDPENTPKTTMPAHLGANVILVWDGKILLEKRRDSDTWGLVGGGVKKQESPLDAIARETYEELGLRIPKNQFQKLRVYGEPGRVAAYRDGSVWRMVIVVFRLELEKKPTLRISAESRQLRFFTPAELENIEIVVTHSDIVEECFLQENMG